MRLSINWQRQSRYVLMIFFLMLSMMSAVELRANPADGAAKGLTNETANPPAGTPAESQQASPAEAPIPSAAPPELIPPPPMLSPASVASRHTSPVRDQITEALLQKSFTYEPKDMVDPFVSFIAPVETAPVGLPEESEEPNLPPVPQKPLTPLQKMSLSEIEKGLRAITWGDLGRKAVIEDAAGKGYIVSVGTPAGDKNGMITEIFNDGLIIQQESWDKKLKRVVPQNSLVKIKRGKEQ